jgi:hypothetical protein
MIKARIVDGKVAKVLPAAKLALFPPHIQAEFIDAPDTVTVGDVFDGVTFSKPQPSAANVAATKVAELSAACRAQIVDGYDSAALGAMYHYPAQEQDQANMVASVTASLVPGLPADWVTPFWCRDAAGAWAFRPHTAAQIQQAGVDGKAAITAALEQNATLAAQVQDIAADAGMADVDKIAAINEVTW